MERPAAPDTSADEALAQAEHQRNRPGPDAPKTAWIDWANLTPQLRGLGISCTAIGEGTAEFTIQAVPYVANPNGSVNGGMLAALADQAMGVLSTLNSPPGYLCATASLHIQFHRPARSPLGMSATLLPGGKRVKFVEVILSDCDGNHCATAQGTMIVGGAGRPADNGRTAEETQ